MRDIHQGDAERDGTLQTLLIRFRIATTGPSCFEASGPFLGFGAVRLVGARCDRAAALFQRLAQASLLEIAAVVLLRRTAAAQLCNNRTGRLSCRQWCDRHSWYQRVPAQDCKDQPCFHWGSHLFPLCY